MKGKGKGRNLYNQSPGLSKNWETRRMEMNDRRAHADARKNGVNVDVIGKPKNRQSANGSIMKAKNKRPGKGSKPAKGTEKLAKARLNEFKKSNKKNCK
jgi:hypothetical protein